MRTPLAATVAGCGAAAGLATGAAAFTGSTFAAACTFGAAGFAGVASLAAFVFSAVDLTATGFTEGSIAFFGAATFASPLAAETAGLAVAFSFALPAVAGLASCVAFLFVTMAFLLASDWWLFSDPATAPAALAGGFVAAAGVAASRTGLAAAVFDAGGFDDPDFPADATDPADLTLAGCISAPAPLPAPFASVLLPAGTEEILPFLALSLPPPSPPVGFELFTGAAAPFAAVFTFAAVTFVSACLPLLLLATGMALPSFLSIIEDFNVILLLLLGEGIRAYSFFGPELETAPRLPAR